MALGCKMGRGIQVDGKVWIWAQKRSLIHIGDNVIIKSRFGSNLIGLTNPTVFQCLGDGVIIIGNNCGLSSTVISSRSRISIGDRSLIGGNVRILDHDYHSLDCQKRGGPEDARNVKTRSIKIGSDVFIGTNAIILKGVTIGDRAIIGAGAVVSCSVPADETWAGNPARKIK